MCDARLYLSCTKCGERQKMPTESGDEGGRKLDNGEGWVKVGHKDPHVLLE